MNFEIIEKELSQLQSHKTERYKAYHSREISREDFIKIKESLTVQADELSAKKEQLESEYRALLHAQKEEAEARTKITIQIFCTTPSFA